mgnify:CR=1 FL=1
MKIRFLADEMNGDIARWLRIMGFDCLYITGKNLDNKLIEICLNENRILLTSDKELYLKATSRGVNSILTLEESRREKLRKIVETLNLKKLVFKEFRCPVCNSILTKVNSKLVKGKIPDSVVKSHDFVWLCKNCGKVYWEGSHWRNILKFIREVLK